MDPKVAWLTMTDEPGPDVPVVRDYVQTAEGLWDEDSPVPGAGVDEQRLSTFEFDPASFAERVVGCALQPESAVIRGDHRCGLLVIGQKHDKLKLVPYLPVENIPGLVSYSVVPRAGRPGFYIACRVRESRGLTTTKRFRYVMPLGSGYALLNPAKAFWGDISKVLDWAVDDGVSPEIQKVVNRWVRRATSNR